MMFKLSSITMIALTTMFLSVGQVNAAALIAANPVDACNGSNNYDVGHSCAFKQSQGTAQGFCENNACGNLICVPH
ncbi:hypothetical protein IW261DRAFT_1605972 [Armillaria novae-zelandiae]|uniref:Uncharacterized protein n=1 Tax=Armillaria novae-zelandiae TaxID=153914 RepID=A0AA39UEG4_9AGAR|nr:hypothetical protein IW261DRAFT_1605972 [Armillaria novae-zelandiae]